MRCMKGIGNFLGSLLREDLVGKEEKRKEDKEIREEVKRKRKRKEEEKRESEKEEIKTVTVKRRCVDSVATEALTFLVEVKTWRAVVFPGVTCWRILMTCWTVNPGTRMEGPCGGCCD